MSLVEIRTDLAEAYAERDIDRYLAAMNALKAAVPGSEPAEVDDVLETLAVILREARLGRGRGMPAFVYEVVEHATGPGPLLPVFVDRAIEALTGAAAFLKAAAELGIEPPDPADESAEAATVEAFTAAGGDAELVATWFAADDWTRPVLWLCHRRDDVRPILPRREELAAAVDAVDMHVDAARWLPDLLRVLDDETLLVLHRSSGRGFRVTIAGVGDNFQLHTLLAVHLIGTGKVGGTPPSAAAEAAATTGAVEVGPNESLHSHFELRDAHGERVWHQQAVPADIPQLDGERVLVLDEPDDVTMVWGTGRTYPHMVPSMTVADLPPEEAAVWWGRVVGRSA